MFISLSIPLHFVANHILFPTKMFSITMFARSLYFKGCNILAANNANATASWLPRVICVCLTRQTHISTRGTATRAWDARSDPTRWSDQTILLLLMRFFTISGLYFCCLPQVVSGVFWLHSAAYTTRRVYAHVVVWCCCAVLWARQGSANFYFEG